MCKEGSPTEYNTSPNEVLAQYYRYEAGELLNILLILILSADSAKRQKHLSLLKLSQLRHLIEILKTFDLKTLQYPEGRRRDGGGRYKQGYVFPKCNRMCVQGNNIKERCNNFDPENNPIERALCLKLTSG